MRIDEKRGGVESHDIYYLILVSSAVKARQEFHTSTHLLCNHDNEASEGSAAHTSDGEQLREPGEVARPAGYMLFRLGDSHGLDIAIPKHDFLKAHLRMNIVKIASCLKRRIAESAERPEGVFVAILFDVPAR